MLVDTAFEYPGDLLSSHLLTQRLGIIDLPIESSKASLSKLKIIPDVNAAIEE